MKEYDRVVLTVEKEKYAKEGVHRGMSGIICDPRQIGCRRIAGDCMYFGVGRGSGGFGIGAVNAQKHKRPHKCA